MGPEPADITTSIPSEPETVATTPEPVKLIAPTSVLTNVPSSYMSTEDPAPAGPVAPWLP